MTTERTDFAQDALDLYLAQPVAPEYVNSDSDMQLITETDAFVAGWEASIDHLLDVVDDLDIPGPLKAIVESMLEANRAEREVKE